MAKKIKQSSHKRALPRRASRFPVKIEYINEKGHGVAFYQGHKLNVPKTLPGEQVLVEYDPTRPRKDRIHLIKILETSPHRQTPPCQYFDECGGCHLQHMDYALQQTLKRQIIERQLAAYPILKPLAVAPVSGMPEPLHYRNKCQMPFQEQGGTVVYGLYRSGTHQLIPVEECLVETRDANAALKIVKQWAEQYRVPVYDEITREGILRHLVVRKGMFTNQVMVILVVKSREITVLPRLLQALKYGLPALHSVYLNIQPDPVNTILGEENILMWGEPYIEEQIGRLRFRIYPHTFFQVNSVQTVKLLEQLLRTTPLEGTDVVLDLYSGVGTVALYIAPRVKQVIGIEADSRAVHAANENAENNQVRNVQFIAGVVEKRLAEFLTIYQPHVVVVDPPRKGLHPDVVQALLNYPPKQLVYISCNPKTLARDLALLMEGGYKGNKIYPFDMFPQTAHVESLITLEFGGNPSNLTSGSGQIPGDTKTVSGSKEEDKNPANPGE